MQSKALEESAKAAARAPEEANGLSQFDLKLGFLREKLPDFTFLKIVLYCGAIDGIELRDSAFARKRPGPMNTPDYAVFDEDIKVFTEIQADVCKRGLNDERHALTVVLRSLGMEAGKQRKDVLCADASLGLAAIGSILLLEDFETGCKSEKYREFKTKLSERWFVNPRLIP